MNLIINLIFVSLTSDFLIGKKDLQLFSAGGIL